MRVAEVVVAAAAARAAAATAAAAVAVDAAVAAGQVAAVVDLLGAEAGTAARVGVGMDPRDELGRTPLMAAAAAGFDGVVTALLAAGADVRAKGDNDETALHKVGPDAHCPSQHPMGFDPWYLAEWNGIL